MDILQKRKFLKDNGLFKDLDEKDIKKISVYFSEQAQPAHSVFINQEEEATSVYFVVKGSVRIYRLTEDGKEVGIAVRGAGEVIGEMAFLNENKRSATVESIQDTILISIAGEDFKKLLYQYPVIGINLLKIMTKRLEDNTLFIEEIMSQSLKRRTWDMLHVLAKYFPNHSILLSQEELSTIIGATRARVTEVLNELQHEGKITLAHKKIHVV